MKGGDVIALYALRALKDAGLLDRMSKDKSIGSASFTSVGYGADAGAIAAATGAYTSADSRYVQSTGFLLDPDGRVEIAVYSSGAIGRLVPDDVAGYVRYLMTHA